MADITASLVKELRDKSGAGMMDCKSALVATSGDIEAGMDWLRTKGLSKAAKKSDRVAAEGLIGLASRGTNATMVEVNSETDFVAKNDSFQTLVRNVVVVASTIGPDVEAIRIAAYPGGGTVTDAISNAIATIGENMTLRRVASLSVQQGVVASYVHTSISEGLGRIGVLVALESPGKLEELSVLGRQIAMHIAATNPVALDAAGVDPVVLAREKAILMEKNAGKPANVLEKITESGLKSYYKEVTLLEQPFVIDPTKSVAQAVKEAEGRVGGAISLTGFVRYGLGDGIEKKVDDFAAEVAAAVKG
jgi:elongation factor Ts